MGELELWRFTIIGTTLLVGVGLLIANYLLYRRLGQALKNIARENEKSYRNARAQATKDFATLSERFMILDQKSEKLQNKVTTFAETSSKQNNQNIHQYKDLLKQIDLVKSTNVEIISAQEKLQHRFTKRSDQMASVLKSMNRSLKIIEKEKSSVIYKEKEQKNQEKIAALSARLNASEARSDMLRAELKKLHTRRRDTEADFSSIKMRMKDREERKAFITKKNGSSDDHDSDS